jgi:hypothetical protein
MEKLKALQTEIVGVKALRVMLKMDLKCTEEEAMEMIGLYCHSETVCDALKKVVMDLEGPKRFPNALPEKTCKNCKNFSTYAQLYEDSEEDTEIGICTIDGEAGNQTGMNDGCVVDFKVKG